MNRTPTATKNVTGGKKGANGMQARYCVLSNGELQFTRNVCPFTENCTDPIQSPIPFKAQECLIWSSFPRGCLIFSQNVLLNHDVKPEPECRLIREQIASSECVRWWKLVALSKHVQCLLSASECTFSTQLDAWKKNQQENCETHKIRKMAPPTMVICCRHFNVMRLLYQSPK